jgi:hypothetical protein
VDFDFALRAHGAAGVIHRSIFSLMYANSVPFPPHSIRCILLPGRDPGLVTNRSDGIKSLACIVKSLLVRCLFGVGAARHPRSGITPLPSLCTIIKPASPLSLSRLSAAGTPSVACPKTRSHRLLRRLSSLVRQYLFSETLSAGSYTFVTMATPQRR